MSELLKNPGNASENLDLAIKNYEKDGRVEIKLSAADLLNLLSDSIETGSVEIKVNEDGSVIVIDNNFIFLSILVDVFNPIRGEARLVANLSNNLNNKFLELDDFKLIKESGGFAFGPTLSFAKTKIKEMVANSKELIQQGLIKQFPEVFNKTRINQLNMQIIGDKLHLAINQDIGQTFEEGEIAEEQIDEEEQPANEVSQEGILKTLLLQMPWKIGEFDDLIISLLDNEIDEAEKKLRESWDEKSYRLSSDEIEGILKVLIAALEDKKIDWSEGRRLLLMLWKGLNLNEAGKEVIEKIKGSGDIEKEEVRKVIGEVEESETEDGQEEINKYWADEALWPTEEVSIEKFCQEKTIYLKNILHQLMSGFGEDRKAGIEAMKLSPLDTEFDDAVSTISAILFVNDKMERSKIEKILKYGAERMMKVLLWVSVVDNNQTARNLIKTINEFSPENPNE